MFLEIVFALKAAAEAINGLAALTEPYSDRVDCSSETSHPVSAFGYGGGLFRCVRESKAFGGEVSDSLIETTNRGEREPNQLSAVNHLAISGLPNNFLPRHLKFCQKGI